MAHLCQAHSAQGHYRMKNQLLLETEVVKYVFGGEHPETTATWRCFSLELKETVQCGFLRWPLVSGPQHLGPL